MLCDTLLYLGNKSIAHSTQLFTRVLQNRCSKSKNKNIMELHHTMKEFQVRHSQCDSIIFPETFSL